jgi:hypothetical protein
MLNSVRKCRLLYVLLPFLALNLGCNHAVTSPTDPDLAQSYQQAGTHLKAAPPETDKAITLIEAAVKRDPDNGMNHYALAIAHAKQNDWTQTIKEMETGNAGKVFRHYVRQGPLHKYSLFEQLSAFVKSCEAVAPSLPGTDTLKMFTAMHDMGDHIARSEPRQDVCLRIGGALRKRADNGLSNYYKLHDHPGEAQRYKDMAAEDQRWINLVKKTFDDELTKLGPEPFEKIFGDPDIKAFGDGSKTPKPEDMDKLKRLDEEYDKLVRPIADRLLQQMP